MELPRQEHWSDWPFPSLGELPNPGIEPASPTWAGGFFTAEPPGRPAHVYAQTYTLLGVRTQSHEVAGLVLAGKPEQAAQRRGRTNRGVRGCTLERETDNSHILWTGRLGQEEGIGKRVGRRLSPLLQSSRLGQEPYSGNQSWGGSHLES